MLRTTLLTLCLLAVIAFSRGAAAAEPASDVDQRISALIQRLGDPQFAARQRAQQELIEIGFDAFDALSDARSSDDPEIAMQATYLVRTIRSGWTELDGKQQVPQILVDYDALSEERRLVCIKQLAELPDDGGLEWLCRLVRFEDSPALSKQAALAIITQPVPTDAAAWARRAERISKHMNRSRRPAAKWLLVDLRLHDDPAGALADWTALTTAERKLLEEHPQDTGNGIVTKLLQRTVDLLERQGQTEQAAEVMREIVLCERGDTASLVALINWLTERMAWNVVDEVATRFAATFELDALLLYVLCDARQKQGDQPAAEELAAKALKLSGDNPVEHLLVVERLQEQGLTDCADRELRHVIALGPIASPAAINARLILSDSLHDRLRDQEAADSLKELVDAIDNDANVMQQVKLLLQQRRKSIDFLRARMYFYLACGAESRDDAAGRRALLEKALTEEPSDLDVLIALYRAGDDDAARRAKLLRTIESVVEDCRAHIEDEPEDPIFYNELAWLVANTEGDIDEALRLSHKSVDLVRTEAASDSDFKRLGQYLDTLGHCYYAKKDFENAVKFQSEAAKLDPHTQAISRQLGVFRESLAKSKAGK